MSFKKHFPGQLPEEQVFAIIHRHWFNIFSHFIAIAICTIATLLLLFVSPVIAKFFEISLDIRLVTFFATTTLLFLWVYGFIIWIDYYFDVWIITGERILNIEQKGLFTRVASEVSFTRVQDVTTRVEGFLPTLLHYGDIFIQTAGEEKRFHFRNISDPDTYKDQIVQLVKKVTNRQV